MPCNSTQQERTKSRDQDDAHVDVTLRAFIAEDLERAKRVLQRAGEWLGPMKVDSFWLRFQEAIATGLPSRLEAIASPKRVRFGRNMCEELLFGSMFVGMKNSNDVVGFWDHEIHPDGLRSVAHDFRLLLWWEEPKNS